MQSTIEQEKLIFNYVLKHPEYYHSMTNGFFKNDDIEMLSKHVRKFHSQYSEAPSCEQMKILTQSDIQPIDPDIIDSIYNVNLTAYDNEWLKRSTESWIRWNTFQRNLIKSVEYTKLTDVDIMNVDTVVMKAISMIEETKTVNFDDNLGLDFFNPDNHTSTIEDKVPCSYKFINDAFSGGLDPKTLNCYLGAPNVGKCCDGSTKVTVRNKTCNITLSIKMHALMTLTDRNLNTSEMNYRSNLCDFADRSDIIDLDHLENTVDTHELSRSVERKFVEVNANFKTWEIETDRGWSDIACVGRTIEYETWELKTKRGYTLLCADTHIVFDDAMCEIYVKDLNKDTRPDKIWVKDADGTIVCDTVVSVQNLGYMCTMYDVQVNDDDHRYLTNNIVSHNSLFLCNDAANFVRMGKNVVYISCEMSDKKVQRRIAANMLDIDLRDYDKIVSQPDGVKKRMEYIKNQSFLPMGHLLVKQYPTSTATTLDIEAYVKDIEERYQYKVNVLIIDYIGIMSNYRNANSENTYIKIKQLSEDLRALAVKQDVIVMSAMQIGKDGFNSTDMTIKDVAESVALIHTCDNIFGIIQDDSMYVNREYKLKILKVREGESKNEIGSIDVMYEKMKLIERVGVTDTLEHLRDLKQSKNNTPQKQQTLVDKVEVQPTININDVKTPSSDLNWGINF